MKRIFLAMLFGLLFMLPSCAARPLTATRFMMDTIVEVSLYRGGTQAILEESLTLCQYYDHLLSKTNPDGDIGRINAANGQPVTVSDETATLLNRALDYGRLSKGAFDITIGAVSALWDFKAENPQLPDPETLRKAVATVDYRKVRVEGNTVQLLDPDAQLDLGGIAKGYIADKMAEFLRAKGVTSAIVNLGGNVYTIGDKDGTPFHVGIRDPLRTDGEEIARVTLLDSSAVTSGSYERGFTLAGKRYHHLLDSRTGYPADSDILSVTVLCPRSVDADALSTLCFLLGVEGCSRFLRDYPDISAVLVDLDGRVTTVNHPPMLH